MNPQLPEVLRYSKSLNALNLPGTKMNLRKYRPETSTGGYTPSNRTIRIPIAGNDVFIDTNRSVLTFKATATYTTGTLYLDNSAFSFIDNIRIYGGDGQILEEINNYGVIANRLADINMPVDEREGIRGKYAGFNNNFPLSTAGMTAFTSGTAIYFQIPLVASGILNMTSKAHNGGVLLPIALLNSGLTIEINLVANLNDPFCSADASVVSAWQIDDVSYDATVVSFAPEVVNSLRQAAVASGGVFVSSYTHHGQVVSSGSQSVSLNMAERAKSIKSIYVTPKLVSQSNDVAQMWSATPAPSTAGTGTLNAYLQLASMNYPNVALNTFADVARELEKAVGTACAGVVDRATLESSTVAFATTAASPGRFTLGFDLDTVSREQLEAGYDNSSQSIPIVVNMDYGSSANRYFYIHSLVDMVVKLDPITGFMSVSY
jgi:hypothetical protein